MIVIDCSALVSAYTDLGEIGRAARDRIAKSDAILAPYLLDVELSSALLGMARGVRGGQPKLTQPALDAALRDYAGLRVQRMEHLPLLPRVRELSANMSAYDATYVALAELYDVPLVTADVRIARSGVARCAIDLLAEHAG
ncbi:type II toxin-antitoxin system VapC family toxin [Streptodolium elevatio]|uniref:Type II toxin-antitoxin system VapC family toxin n=1 Tax=Streptodolium elevatio TaxID=3157996 RepID=A0ABV3DP18_9ACTN